MSHRSRSEKRLRRLDRSSAGWRGDEWRIRRGLTAGIVVATVGILNLKLHRHSPLLKRSIVVVGVFRSFALAGIVWYQARNHGTVLIKDGADTSAHWGGHRLLEMLLRNELIFAILAVVDLRCVGAFAVSKVCVGFR